MVVLYDFGRRQTSVISICHGPQEIHLIGCQFFGFGFENIIALIHQLLECISKYVFRHFSCGSLEYIPR